MKKESKYTERKMKVINWLLASDTRFFFVLYILFLIPVIPAVEKDSPIFIILLINALMSYVQMLVLKILLYNNRFGTQSIQMLEALKIAKTVDEHLELGMIYDKLVDELKQNSHLAYVLCTPFWADTKACIKEFTKMAQEIENLEKQ